MTRRDLAFLAIGLALCAAILAYAYTPHGSSPLPATTWTRSVDRAPPEDVPIIGFWIDGSQPIPLACVRYREIYYEYRPGTAYPAPLYGYAPVYWIDMPGGAK